MMNKPLTEVARGVEVLAAAATGIACGAMWTEGPAPVLVGVAIVAGLGVVAASLWRDNLAADLAYREGYEKGYEVGRYHRPEPRLPQDLSRMHVELGALVGDFAERALAALKASAHITTELASLEEHLRTVEDERDALRVETKAQSQKLSRIGGVLTAQADDGAKAPRFLTEPQPGHDDIFAPKPPLPPANVDALIAALNPAGTPQTDPTPAA